jgi:hypothetical protein
VRGPSSPVEDDRDPTIPDEGTYLEEQATDPSDERGARRRIDEERRVAFGIAHPGLERRWCCDTARVT